MTPITKNIIVVDENGKEYEATYPKRAKGLVKNGRARFVSENKICLACPPEYNLEDNKMSDDININNLKQQSIDMASDLMDYQRNALSEMKESQKTEKLSMNYVLEQIEKITTQNDYLYNTIQKLGEMSNAAGPGDLVGASKAEALGDVVKCRETTNQQLLRLYEKMYDDLKPKSRFNAEQVEILFRYANELPPIQAKELMSEILSKVL